MTTTSSNLLALYIETDAFLEKASPEEVREKLKSSDLKESLKVPDRILVSSNFKCPVISTEIVVPCNLGTCKYHVPYEWSNNCLLMYAQQQGTHTLSNEEISYIYSLPIDTINKSVDKSMALLRKEALLAEAVSNFDFEKQYQYVQTKKLCATCSSKILDKKDKVDVKNTNFAYCSTECAEEKPPAVILLEDRLGLDIELILGWFLKKFKTLALAEKALSMSRTMLEDVCQKFLGKKITDFYPESDTVAKKLTIYQLSPSNSGINTLNHSEECLKVVKTKYGAGTLDFLDITNKYKNIIDL